MRKSKLNTLIDSLLEKELTITELLIETKLTKESIISYLKYYIPKKGFNVIKGNKEGILSYKLERQ